MKPSLLVVAIFTLNSVLNPYIATGQDLSGKIESHVRPLVNTNNFSGQIVVAKGFEILFSGNYGLADRTVKKEVLDNTRFQIASVSKSITAAAIVKLQENELLSYEDKVSKFIPSYPRGNEISIHHLLTHTSGIPNINRFPTYDSLSLHPQTPLSLVEHFKEKPLEFTPGERYRYSNSNYNLLALIIEVISKKSYGDFLKEQFFKPLEMHDSGHPSERSGFENHFATGYIPIGIDEVHQAESLDWTVKTGNGSLFSSARDLLKWSHALFLGNLLKFSSVEDMIAEQVENVGYGWFIRPRHGERQYHINGRSPGFSSIVSHYPDHELTIVILSNNYAPVATNLSVDIAAMYLGRPYQPILKGLGTITEKESTEILGTYQFGPDFYQPNKVLEVKWSNDYLFIDWGVLYNRGDQRFINRDYWMNVSFKKSASGERMMVYDDFEGRHLNDR